MKQILTLIALLVLTACEPKPDASLVLYSQPDPAAAARLMAHEIEGEYYVVSDLSHSMAPFIVPGDYVVVDIKFPFTQIKVSDTLTYQANWLPIKSAPVTHMAAARNADGSWVMDGIDNAHYENGKMSMTKQEYRGKVVQVFTKRQRIN